MSATGKTPILLYGSTTATNTPSAGNLTNSSDGCEIAINVADKNLFFKDSTNVVNTVPIRQSGTSSNGWLSSTDWNTFNGKASTSSPTFSGDVTLSTGNLVIGTSGKGIDFSATPGTGTSELLADYEEGTFTPAIIGNTSSGVGTYTYQIGRYTKTGNRVNYSIYLNWSAHTGTGYMIVTGLPYTTNSTTANFTTPAVWQNSIALNANSVLTALVSTGVTSITLYQYVSGGGNVSTVTLDTAGELILTGTYEV